MDIIHVVPSYLPALRYGGPILAVHDLCKSHAAHGHNVTVFTTNIDGPGNLNVPLSRPLEIDGVKVWYFPVRMRRLCWAPQMKRRLSEIMRHIDIVHLHSVFLWPTWTAAAIARKYNKPYVISPHGMLVMDLFKMKSWNAKMSWMFLKGRQDLEHAAVIRVTSEYERNELFKLNLHWPRIENVSNAIELSDYEDRGSISSYIQEITAAGSYLLFLGRINWKKGLDRLIAAMQYVTDARLLICGNDDENYTPYLESLVYKYGLTEKIQFVGPIFGSDKWYLYRHAIAMVLPSYSENFGNVVLEAMAVGCPVVVTPEVGASEIVAAFNAGIVVDGDPVKLGAALRKIMSSSEERAKMCEAGIQAVARHYTWDKVASKLEQIYTEAIISKAATARGVLSK